MEAPWSVSIGSVVLDKYRVEQILGKGGMGVVVAARHLHLDELFALKLMLPSVAANPEALERFLREAQAAARLKGDHTVKVHDVGRLPDGTSYMLMEYLTGADFKKILRQRRALPVDEAVRYILQACEALREAHKNGIVHRDIKPANIFLTNGPNGAPRVKIIDFGISKHTAGDAGDLTATNTVGGSPFYMSPEQMRSAKYVDHRTDIWAIGVVLYELLTGVTPFHAPTVTAVATRVVQDDPGPPSALRPEIPAWLDMVVWRCLQKRPEDRFQTVEELSRALGAPGAPAVEYREQTAVEDKTVPVVRGNLPSISSEAAYRPEGTAVPALGAVSQAAGSSTTYGFSQVSPNENVPFGPGAQRAPKGNTLAAGAIAGLVLGVAIGVGVWVRGRSSGEPVVSDSGSAASGAEAKPPVVVAPMEVTPAAAGAVSGGSGGVVPTAPTVTATASGDPALSPVASASATEGPKGVAAAPTSTASVPSKSAAGGAAAAPGTASNAKGTGATGARPTSVRPAPSTTGSRTGKHDTMF